ncbi:MAG: winged helix DNA-binding protein [Chloroflexi bacterium]|nr:winged helix DNA-binding protein [Chloroflexota bacterium]
MSNDGGPNPRTPGVWNRYIALRYNPVVAAEREALTEPEYRALAQFRFQLRQFLHFSEQAARAAGLEPHQHQFLLALKGLGTDGAASIGDLARWLQVRHHSAVELADRVEGRGLVERTPDRADRRRVLVRLTPAGQEVLHRLSIEHQRELRSAAPALLASLGLLLAEHAIPAPAPDDRRAPAAVSHEEAL